MVSDPSFPRPKIFRPLDAVLRTKQRARGWFRSMKKSEHWQGFFLNDFFMDGGDFCWKGLWRCVIVSLSKLRDGTRRRVRNITVSTARKMCACNSAQPLGLRPRSSWQGAFPAPLHPPARAFSPWTRPGRFHPPDPRPWGPSCPPWTPRPRETSLSLWTPIDQGGLRARPWTPRPREPSRSLRPPIDQAFAMDRAKGVAPWPPSPSFRTTGARL